MLLAPSLLNLFVGVICDAFDRIKKESEHGEVGDNDTRATAMGAYNVGRDEAEASRSRQTANIGCRKLLYDLISSTASTALSPLSSSRISA